MGFGSLQRWQSTGLEALENAELVGADRLLKGFRWTAGRAAGRPAVPIKGAGMHHGRCLDGLSNRLIAGVRFQKSFR